MAHLPSLALALALALALPLTPAFGAVATEDRALSGGKPGEAVLDAIEVLHSGDTERWRFRFSGFGAAKGTLPEYQLRYEERQESVESDGTPKTRRPARLILLVRRLRRVRPAPERWLGPAAKSDWVEKVRLWPAIEEDDRAFEIELREGGTHRLVAEGSTLELRLGPAAVLR